MYCGECGTKNNKESTFCSECGAKLKEENKVNKVNKNPMSKKKKILIILILILIALLILGYNFLNKKYSAESVATDYFKAIISNDPNKIYDALNLTDSEFTTKKDFEKIYEETYKDDIEVLNYSLIDMEYEDDNLTVEAEFKVIFKDSQEDTITIKLIKDKKKKLLIFDSWYVYNENNLFVVNDYTINVPKGTIVSINDKKVEEKYLDKKESDEEEDVYVIPQIIVGKSIIKTKLPCGIETEKEVNISTYNDHYKLDIDINTLSEEMTKKLQDKIKEDINNIYANLISKKSWNDVRSDYIYNKTDLSDLEDEYDGAYEEIAENTSKQLKKFNVTDVTINSISVEDNKIKIRCKINYDYTLDYNKKTYNENSSYITNIIYDYYDNEYKIYDISSLVTYFFAR